MLYILIYILNIVLLMLYVLAIATTGTFFFIEKDESYQKILFLLIIYFVNCFVDGILISMTETFPAFDHYLASTFGKIFGSKTVFYFINNICMINIFALFCRQHVKVRDYIIIAGVTIMMILMSTLPETRLHVFLFYFSAESYFIYIGYKLYSAAKQGLITDNYLKLTKLIAYLNMFFGSLIIIEDAIVVFFIDQYNKANLGFIYRNYSECIFLIILSLVIIYYTAFFYRTNQSTPVIPTATESDSNYDKLEEISADKFQSFCLKYRLTERETEVLKHLLNKETNQSIADELFLSLGTIKTHIHNIYSKINISKRKELFEVYENHH